MDAARESMRVRSGITDQDEMKERMRTKCAKLSHIVSGQPCTAASICPDQRCVFCASFLVLLSSARSNQPDSNLTKLEVTVKVKL